LIVGIRGNEVVIQDEDAAERTKRGFKPLIPLCVGESAERTVRKATKLLLELAERIPTVS
jgi:hypothetical protein